VLLGRALGREALDPETASRQLAARAAGARRSDAEELRQAVLRRWIDGSAAAAVVGGAALRDVEAVAAAGAMEPQAEDAADLARFARRVLDAARRARTGRFGAHKVFISHVWRVLAEEQPSTQPPLDAFKRRLAAANQAGLLALSRADLVEAMDPRDVSESEVADFGSTFHFVRCEEPSR
jgi:hypothetical protein